MTDPRPPEPATLTSANLALYVLVVLVWGTSWLAISLQAGPVPPEVSVLWRFAIACPVMFAWAVIARHRLGYGFTDHLLFAGLGATLFCTNFVLFYRASLSITSGLMAVVFSLASIFNVLLGAIFLRQAIEPHVVAAGLVGVIGVALMFAPEVIGHDIGWAATQGLIASVGATLSFCTANIISTASQRRGVRVIPATAWGMLYGVGYLTLLSLLLGHAFIVEWSARYLSSLVWLALVASVIAFASYLTLLGRIGPARAGYMSAMFPVVALAVSTVFEGYQWTPLAVLGLAMVMAGNVLALRR